MRITIITIFILFGTSFLFAQDGSNIYYVEPQKLDKTYVGRTIQIDFYRKSRGLRRDKNDGINLDKVLLEIDGKQVEFIEHREDDGYNNWFSGQYLESVDKKIRIKEFKLLKIEKETILVAGYLTEKPFSQEFSFKKSDIAQILVKATEKN